MIMNNYLPANRKYRRKNKLQDPFILPRLNHEKIEKSDP